MQQPEPELAEGDSDSDTGAPAPPCDDNLVIDFKCLGANPDFDHEKHGADFETMCELVGLEDWDGNIEIAKESKKQRRRKQRPPSSSGKPPGESGSVSEGIEATAQQEGDPVLRGSGSGGASNAKEIESPSSHGDIGAFSCDTDLDFEFSGESGTEWSLRDEKDARHAESYKHRFEDIMGSMESMESLEPAVSKATIATQLIALLVGIQLHRRRVHAALALRMRQDAKVKCSAAPAANKCLHASWRFREEGLLKLLEVISYDTVGRGWRRLRNVIDQRLHNPLVITYGLSSPSALQPPPSPLPPPALTAP
jgi:hypothetical protein